MKEMVRSTGATIVALQETKLQMVDDNVVRQTLGQHFINNYSFLPAVGTRGGILVAASERHFKLVASAATKNTLTIRIQMLNESDEWDLTAVYGPQRKQSKLRFIEELKRLNNYAAGPWLIVGDFNLIYRMSDKNNNRVDRELMRKFKQALDHLGLKEIHLNGRKFTWSNGQENPTLTRIDRMFSTLQWDDKFPTCHLQALVSTLSDHCPLMMQGVTEVTAYKGFRFENFWIHMPGFTETVAAAWNKPVQATDPFRKLHIKMCRTGKALKKWQKTKIGNIKMQIEVAKEILWHFDVAEENRVLTHDELECRRRVKLKYQGLIAIEKVKAKQRARLTAIRTTDANTKLFHVRANGRKRRNHIQVLQTDAGMVVKHEDKADEIHKHFQQTIGSSTRREMTLNWEQLDINPYELAELERDISEEEVKAVVMEMPKDKAPGPDGFTGYFYKTCWEIIKGDVNHALHQLSQLRGNLFNLTNSANVVLIPKRRDRCA